MRLAGYNKSMYFERGRFRMEERYGDIGTGGSAVVVGGVQYGLKQVFARWMMDVPEVWTIDGGTLSDGRHWIRFLDGDDRYIVAFEFDDDFEILSEMRVDSLAWEKDNFFISRTR